MTAAPTAATPETRIEAVKQSLAASKSALKQYEWVETVALSKDGEEKARQQSRCYRDATGAMKKSPMAADTSKAEKKGGLRGKRAAKKQGAMDATLKAAVQVLHQYMPVDPVKIEAAKGEGNVSVSLPGDDNRVRITIKNYAQPGDEVTLVVDAATNAVKAATVKTSMAAEKGEKSPVAAQVTYGALPDGTLYPATAALDLSAQAIKVDVQNTGYKKQAS
jgi:DNA-binding protein YbaB